MCTVTILRLGNGLARIVCNRDEQRIRASALPPRNHLVDGMLYVAPLDAEAGGTWIAVNRVGLACVLLNRNTGESVPAGKRSRGEVIPQIITAATLARAVDLLEELSLEDYAPFRLVITDGILVAELVHEPSARQRCTVQKLTEPLLYTSSGLGDAVVEPSRRKLFEATLLPDPTRKAQDAFHRHRWPDRLPLSVMMSRADACTVSITEIVLAPHQINLHYRSCQSSSELPVTFHVMKQVAPCRRYRQAS
jgi:hypothetical protein